MSAYAVAERLQGVDGKTIYSPKIPESKRPDLLAEHGTRVTLFGMSEEQDTMLPPEGIGGIRESWIALYLTTRFFTIPEGVKISVRIGYYRDVENTKHNY